MIALLALLAAAVALSVLLASSRAQVRDLKSALLARDAELRSEREVRSAESAARAALEARLDSSEEKHQRLQETFAALSRQALDANTAHLVQLADQVLRRAQESSQAELDRRTRAVEEMVRPVQESLGRVDEKIGKLEKAGDVTAARLSEQVRALAAQEVAGLRAHVDFLEQPVAQLADGVLRPDVAVRLPGEKTVLLDAKVPLEAYLKSVEAPEADREALLVAHAAQLRAHVDCLSRKQYWEAFAGSPEMAVLFLPSEGLLAAALEVDPALHEDAFAKRIVLATPATLLALLLTIAHVWKQDSIAANAREIANEGRELHKRIADLSRHMAKLGRALESALKTYNGAVGSFDSRLLPAARRFEELKASAVDVQLDPLAEVEVLPRLPRPASDEGLPDDAN